MRAAELAWFRLGFPRDVSVSQVLAVLTSLSGAPHGTRMVFDLEASEDGIVHRLAITPAHEGILLAALRAGIPSLRADRIGAPTKHMPVRLLWQLDSPRAVLRADEPAATSASLLSSLFPLERGEAVRLRWTMRPHPQSPRPSVGGQRAESDRALNAKAKLPTVKAFGELSVDAGTGTRVRGLVQRVSASLWSLRTPNGRLVADPPMWGQAGYRLGRRGRHLNVAELAAVIGWPVEEPDLPGLELGAAKRVVPSGALARDGRVLGISNAAGVSQPVALSPSSSTRGLYMLGPTGTGKTSLLKNLIRDDLKQGRGLAVVETNGDLIRDVLDLIPPERTGDVVLLDPTDRSHAVGFNPFAGSNDPSLVADQISELFQRLWKAYWGPRTGQLAHMGLLTLAERPGSTLLDLPRLFLDERVRAEVLSSLNDPVGLEPDWRWFQGLAGREQATVVAPLLNKVRQFTARSSIRGIIGQAEPAVSMRSVMAERKILLVNLPKGLIGSETATLLGCLVLTSLWQAATERAALPNDQREPFWPLRRRGSGLRCRSRSVGGDVRPRPQVRPRAVGCASEPRPAPPRAARGGAGQRSLQGRLRSQCRRRQAPGARLCAGSVGRRPPSSRCLLGSRRAGAGRRFGVAAGHARHAARAEGDRQRRGGQAQLTPALRPTAPRR